MRFPGARIEQQQVLARLPARLHFGGGHRRIPSRVRNDEDSESLIDALEQYEIGDRVRLRYLRGGEEREVEITLG